MAIGDINVQSVAEFVMKITCQKLGILVMVQMMIILIFLKHDMGMNAGLVSTIRIVDIKHKVLCRIKI